MTFPKYLISLVLFLIVFGSATAQKDRILQSDIGYFNPDSLDAKIHRFVQMYNPIFQSCTGDNYLILNVGWLVDIITNWSGDPNQNLPINSKKLKPWSGKSYSFLKEFIQKLYTEFAESGTKNLNIGLSVCGWGVFDYPEHVKLYDFKGIWSQRHPELYQPVSEEFIRKSFYGDVMLNADSFSYAAYPKGIPQDLPFAKLLGNQWGSLSKFLDLKSIILRDGFVPPFKNTVGLVERQSYINQIYKEVKQGNPSAKVIGFNDGYQMIRQYRNSNFDLESLVADGNIDMYIFNTKGGVWQDWWNNISAGYTFQVANIITQSAMIQGGNKLRKNPCKVYVTIGVCDAYEPWNILQQYPGKLMWEIWAYTHASTYKQSELKTPDGVYIEWASNHYNELWKESERNIIKSVLDSAQKNATFMDKVYGPTLCYNRQSMEWMNSENPNINATEFVDDQCGMLLKWGLPILASTRMEWLSSSNSEAYWIHLANKLSPENKNQLQQNTENGIPMLFSGRSDYLDKDVLASCGIDKSDIMLKTDYYLSQPFEISSLKLPQYNIVHLSDCPKIYMQNAIQLYGIKETPLITKHELNSNYYWQPLFRMNDIAPILSNAQFGSLVPFNIIANIFRNENSTQIKDIPIEQPLTFHYWRSNGSIYFLIGNLESGFMGDSRIHRKCVLIVKKKQLELLNINQVKLVSQNTGEVFLPIRQNSSEFRFEITVHPESCLILKLEK